MGRLWEILIEPARLYQAEPGSSLEPLLGGALVVDFGGGDDVRGEVLALEPERLLEYSWHFFGEDQSIVRFVLRPHEEGTLLVLDHRRLSRENGLGYTAGWHAYLDRLACTLRGEELDFVPRAKELRPLYQEQALPE